MEFDVEIVTERPEDVVQFLDDRIYEYNSASIGHHDGKLFALVVRDNENKIIAGISGWTWAMVSEVSLFWVSGKFRGSGIGKRLLKAAECEIARRGCKTIFLRSYAFQAPHFYEQQGYEVIFVLEDFPKGYKCYSLL